MRPAIFRTNRRLLCWRCPRLPRPRQPFPQIYRPLRCPLPKYNAAANALDPKNPTANVGQFRRAMIAYLANRAGGNAALATTYLAKFEQLADLGGTWGPLLYKVDDGVGNGTYTLNSAAAN